jgi:type II secretory pathway pseudopilin PulG
MDARPLRCSGFTVLELILMVAIIIALMAMAFVSWRYLKRQTEIASTRGLIASVALAIANYSVTAQQWSWTDAAGTRRVGHLWDLDDQAEVPASSPRFHLLDGRAAVLDDDTHDGGFAPEVIASGYHGFDLMCQPPIPPRSINPRLQIVDPWNQPLRIAYASGVYGTQSFGLWSAGPDGIDDTADDLCSWK